MGELLVIVKVCLKFSSAKLKPETMLPRRDIAYTPLKWAVSFRRSSPGETIVVAWIALNTFIKPAPCCETVCRGSPSVWLLGTRWAVVSNKVRAPFPTAAELPFTENKSALLAARKGVAIDVPDRIAKEPRGTGNVERMLPPGAAMAGLKNMSFVGPKEVKLEIRPPEVSGKLNRPPVCGKEMVTGALAANCCASW